MLWFIFYISLSLAAVGVVFAKIHMIIIYFKLTEFSTTTATGFWQYQWKPTHVLYWSLFLDPHLVTSKKKNYTEHFSVLWVLVWLRAIRRKREELFSRDFGTITIYNDITCHEVKFHLKSTKTKTLCLLPCEDNKSKRWLE